MASENRWYIITQNELRDIQERLCQLEAGLPEPGSKQMAEIHIIFHQVRDRQP